MKAQIIIVAFLVALGFSTNCKAQKTRDQSQLPTLPSPSGDFGVGRIAFDWVDRSRPADMAEDRSPNTELMVYLWYPTEHRDSEAKGVLLPGAAQIDAVTPGVSEALKAKIFGGNWPLVVSGKIMSYAQENVPIAKTRKSFPVVLFSPGAFGSCFQYSSKIEDLVSHGYIVAAIEHTSEVFGVVFPDGKTHVYTAKAIPRQSIPPANSSKEEYENYLESWYRHNVDVRAADLSFVLTRLVALGANSGASPSQFSGRLDMSRVGAVGHSRGGWAAIVACRRDERIKACVNEDGNAGGQGLEYPGAGTPTQSILYVERSPVLEPGTTQDDWIVLKQLHMTAEQWQQQWHETVNKEFRSFPTGGYFVELRIPGLVHYSFSDEVHLQATKDGDRTKEAEALRDMQRTEEITRAFLDEVLEGKKQDVLRNDANMTVTHFVPHRRP